MVCYPILVGVGTSAGDGIEGPNLVEDPLELVQVK